MKSERGRRCFYKPDAVGGEGWARGGANRAPRWGSDSTRVTMDIPGT